MKVAYLRVLGAGYLPGLDLWHVPTAPYLAENPAELPFLTLDARQREVAAGLDSDSVSYRLEQQRLRRLEKKYLCLSAS